jgi:hypothetical protein
MRRLALVILSILLNLGISSQNEAKQWRFGTFAGLDFNTNPPTATSGSAMWTAAGCSSVADSTGALLFYTNGKNVYNKNDVLMANGSGLVGEESITQTGLIVKQPGSQNIYFIFSIATGAQTNGLFYSVVDMSLAAGMGSVTALNVQLYSPTTDKLAATSHCNGTDVWLLSHEFGTNVFRSYMVTSAGINTVAFTSSVGPVVNVANNSAGQMKFSPNGRKLGLASYQTNFELYDFNPSTGQVSNALILAPNIGDAYGCEFSPDGSKFYGSRFGPGGGNIGAHLIQWDICAGSPGAIIASQYSVSVSSTLTPAEQCAALQIAPDGKIYISTIYQSLLSSINNPNSAGANCGYSPFSQSLQSGYAAFGLPSFVVRHFAPTPVAGPFTWTASCQSVSFTPPALVSVTVPCGSMQQTVTSFHWLFGDNGAASTASSSVLNPQYVYSGTGTFAAKLVLHYPCKTDTISVPVTVTNTVPLMSISGNTTICLGESTVLTATGAITYSWNGTAGDNTISVSPPASSSYTVSGSSGSSVCPTTSKIVSIIKDRVHNCTSMYRHQRKPRFYFACISKSCHAHFNG